MDNNELYEAQIHAIQELAYCLAELGLSKEHVNRAFAYRCETDPNFAEAWEVAYREKNDDFWLNRLYERLPDKPGEGQMQYVE